MWALSSIVFSESSAEIASYTAVVAPIIRFGDENIDVPEILHRIGYFGCDLEQRGLACQAVVLER